MYRKIIEDYENMAAIVDGDHHFIIGAMANEIDNLRHALEEIQTLPHCDSYMARTIAKKVCSPPRREEHLLEVNP